MKSDLELYDYWPYAKRPKIVWPNGARVAFWVAPNIEFYEINPPVNPKRAAWSRPNPDVVPLATRDHGNRVRPQAPPRSGSRGAEAVARAEARPPGGRRRSSQVPRLAHSRAV